MNSKTKEIDPQISQMGADSKDRQTHAIIGAAMEVHRQLGPGFLEAVYQQALAIEFSTRNVPFLSETELPVYYKGQRLACSYRADFVCYDEVIVELKALKAVTGVEEAQILNYLKATGLARGLLLNFGRPRLEFKRFAFSQSAFICVICGSEDEKEDQSADVADGSRFKRPANVLCLLICVHLRNLRIRK